jgi:hypothetical protein
MGELENWPVSLETFSADRFWLIRRKKSTLFRSVPTEAF